MLAQSLSRDTFDLIGFNFRAQILWLALVLCSQLLFDLNIQFMRETKAETIARYSGSINTPPCLLRRLCGHKQLATGVLSVSLKGGERLVKRSQRVQTCNKLAKVTHALLSPARTVDDVLIRRTTALPWLQFIWDWVGLGTWWWTQCGIHADCASRLSTS